MVETFCLYFAGSLVIDKDVTIDDILKQKEKRSCKSPPVPVETNKN